MTLLEHVDAATGLLDRGDQTAPLLHRAVRIGLTVEVHVGVDQVVDAEVIRPDHRIVPAPGQRLVGSLRSRVLHLHGHRCLTLSASKEAPSRSGTAVRELRLVWCGYV